MVIYNPDATIFVPEEDAWTALINPCPYIDPNYCYAADTLEVKLGTTNKGSSFKYSFEDYNWWRNEITFGDLIETWIGIQYGTSEIPWDGVSGRKWLCGGFNEFRYTKVDRKGKKTFWIEGYDYTTYLKKLIWGKPDDIKEYTNTAIGAIVSAIGTYLSTLDFVRAEGAATGVDWFDTTITPNVDRRYEKYNKISDIMKDLCNEAAPIADWYLRPWIRIDTGAKMNGMFFHDRGIRSSGMTVDWSNFRSGNLVWGDTRNLLTNIFITNDDDIIIGAKWCDSKASWLAIPSLTMYRFDIIDFRNGTIDPYTGVSIAENLVWCVETQTPAICCYHQYAGGQQVLVGWPYWIEVDLTQFTHLNFWYKALNLDGSYIVKIAHGVPPGNHFMWQEITVSDENWNRFSLELPDIDPAGVVIDPKDWTFVTIGAGGDYTRSKYIEFERTSGANGYMCISNIQFARMINVSGASGLYAFPRYGVIPSPTISTNYEAIEKANAELALLQNPLVYCNPIVDGDPNYLPALTLTLNLTTGGDVEPFASKTRVIDEAKHVVTDKSDYYTDLTLSKTEKRAPPTVENQNPATIRQLIEQLGKVGVGGRLLYPY